MFISTITLTNFRCFGPQPTTITLDNMTALVGSNACGKTAILHALQKLFGVTASERELKLEDFHVPQVTETDDLDAANERTLSIEVRLAFPELKDPEANHDAVAECFRQMVVSKPGHTPHCRVRLEATWNRGSLPEGVIDQHTYWIRSASGTKGQESKHEMRALDRARIQLHYIPAARDPSKHVKSASGSIIGRLLRAVVWSDEVRDNVTSASEEIQNAFSAEAGIEAIRKTLSQSWADLHGNAEYGSVAIRPVSKRFEDILRYVEAVFSPSPTRQECPIERLSDGQRSLFYLAMVGAAFEIEDQVLAADDDDATFDRDRLDSPSLTLFAVEEPENHIAPHYLGRIIEALRKMAQSSRAQVLLTSHSPSIMHRVEPTEVRHCRLDQATRTTIVRPIPLPDKTDSAFKFVREAVRAYPELYFSRLVVLGEGDSEEIVIPKVAEALGVAIDRSFVSVVPLGGRHVNHFWRLLHALEIPHITLLDLDRERDGGGWSRIKYVLLELIANGVPRKSLLNVKAEDGTSCMLSDEEVSQMHTWEDTADLAGWCDFLEGFNVFFSSPLDLDFMMLTHYPTAYRIIDADAHGPSIPEIDDDDHEKQQKAVIRAVLKGSGGDGSSFTTDEINEFYWYRYLFLGRGKPTTHIKALSSLKSSEIRATCPNVLKCLVKLMSSLLETVVHNESGTD